jgi:hypothetical protein
MKIITALLPSWLIWLSWEFPFVHIRRGRKVS